MATTTFTGIYATTKSYDPNGFYGEETSRVDISPIPLATSASFSQPGSVFSGNNVLGTVAYGGISFQALASRPIKVGGVIKGFYVWVDNEGIWSGQGTSLDTAYILSLDNAYFSSNPIGVASSSDRVDNALNSVLGSQSNVPITDPIGSEEPDEPAEEPEEPGQENGDPPLLTPTTDPSEDDDETTADNTPELQIIDEPDQEDDITVEGPDGDELIKNKNYKIKEVEIEDQPGTSVYVIKLTDADEDKGGNQPFGDYYQGERTGNDSGTGNGVYKILRNDHVIGRFEIDTKKLKQAKRLKCIEEIFSKGGNKSLESTLYGYRIKQRSGTNGDDVLSGKADSSDKLTGLKGSDLLNGMGNRLRGSSFNPRKFNDAQIDVLTGGQGSDEFQLADIAGSFYQNRGRADHAAITDFSKSDSLILFGQSNRYQLTSLKGGERELSRDGDLIAILRGKGIGGLDLGDSSGISYF